MAPEQSLVNANGIPCQFLFPGLRAGGLLAVSAAHKKTCPFYELFISIKNVYKPSDVCSKSFLLTSGRYVNKDKRKSRYLFEKPGTYKFQVLLNDEDMKSKVKSNIENIKVKSAVGIDAKALSLLMQITNRADVLFWPIIRDKTEKKRVEKVLEKIINECEESTYAKYACNALARMYFSDPSKSKSYLISQIELA